VSDYNLTKWPVLEGEHLLFCTRCGSLISDSAVIVHDRFHASLQDAGKIRTRFLAGKSSAEAHRET
jgi:hypothetical protein